VQRYEGRDQEAITRRIKELEAEWDIERSLELNASTLALTGLILGATVNKKGLIVPGIVLPFCSSMPFRDGVRPFRSCADSALEHVRR